VTVPESEMREDIMSLGDEGHVTLHWPSKLNREDAADVVEWLRLIVKKIERQVHRASPE
jgi:hypothetical protein